MRQAGVVSDDRTLSQLKNSPSQTGPASMQKVTLTFVVGTFIVFLAYRMTIGIDLSDESYYVSFIDGWLKTGIQASSTLGLHQTAALLVYPFAKLFTVLTGSVDGLVLFLRFIYLLMACAAGSCFYKLVRETHGRTVATFASLTVVTFIPFSLPSPSYNTIGMLSMICAFSSCGVFFLRRSSEHAQAPPHWRWAVGSAFAWTVSVIAYPPLFLVQVILLLGLMFANRKNVPFGSLIKYLFLCVFTQAAGLAILVGTYGIGRMYDMFQFTNASLQVTSGIGEKLKYFGNVFLLHPWFGLASAMSLLVGIALTKKHRPLAIDYVIVLIIFSFLVLSLLAGPALYTQSHDFVFLLAILGAPLCISAQGTPPGTKTTPLRSQIMRLLLFVGLLAGLMTSLTATNGLVNFAVGGSFAMALGITLAIPERKSTAVIALHTLLLAGISGLLLWSSFGFIYGEVRNPLTSDSQRVREGIFAGLLTTDQNAYAIRETSKLFSNATSSHGTIAIFGRLPGVYLLTPSKPMTLSTWDFGQQNGTFPAIEKLNADFYAQTAHRPDILAVVSDPWTKPLSAFSQKLVSEYRPKERQDFGAWSIELYVPRGIK